MGELKTKGKGKGKDGKGKDVKGKAKAKAKASNKPKVTLYTNAICPFAHRAAFAAALCNVEPKIVFTPLSGQLSVADKVGMDALGAQASCAEPFKALTTEQLKAQKEEYKTTINASGGVPSLTTADGGIV